MHVYVVKCLGMTTVAKRVKAANESAKTWKEKKKYLLQKIDGNKDGTIKRVSSWGGAIHYFCQQFVYLDIAQFDFSLVGCMRKSELWL